MSNLPSIKTIQTALSCTNEIAKKIRLIFEGNLDPCEAHIQCANWVKSCYNEPSRHEKMLFAIDCLLDNHGVEYLECKGGRNYSYSNTGDTYALTVIRDHRNARWIVASWGDLVEKYGTSE